MSIVGLGHPLVDISSEVQLAMLEKYGLKPNDMCLAEEKHMPLFKDIVALPTVRYIAGGATQNSIRVAQWMLQCPRMTSFMGCVGDDDFAAKMRAACEYDGVRALYMVDPKVPTGCCAVLIHGEGRTMCTVLNCANNYEAEHLRQPEHWKLIEEASLSPLLRSRSSSPLRRWHGQAGSTA